MVLIIATYTQQYIHEEQVLKNFLVVLLFDAPGT